MAGVGKKYDRVLEVWNFISLSKVNISDIANKFYNPKHNGKKYSIYLAEKILDYMERVGYRTTEDENGYICCDRIVPKKDLPHVHKNFLKIVIRDGPYTVRMCTRCFGLEATYLDTPTRVLDRHKEALREAMKDKGTMTNHTHVWKFILQEDGWILEECSCGESRAFFNGKEKPVPSHLKRYLRLP